MSARWALGPPPTVSGELRAFGVTLTVVTLSSRVTVNSTASFAASPRSRSFAAPTADTASPPILVSTSPTFSPAFSAGDPGARASMTTAPPWPGSSWMPTNPAVTGRTEVKALNVFGSALAAVAAVL